MNCLIVSQEELNATPNTKLETDLRFQLIDKLKHFGAPMLHRRPNTKDFVWYVDHQPNFKTKISWQNRTNIT
jgi:hypothetical protein